MSNETNKAHSLLNSRYIIGIDLGTTNIAVSYIDTEKNYDIQSFKIHQLINDNEITKNKLLPATYYAADANRVDSKSLKLPWEKNSTSAENKNISNIETIGLYALKQGSSEPARFVNSAKSWLCHAGVDRTKDILPWISREQSWAISPLKATAKYLEHIKNSWNYTFAKKKDTHGDFCLFEKQQIIITVPASFDEGARELTIEAAKIAKFKNITLLEEPLAAFYSWLAKNNENYTEILHENAKILIADIGGGTTDFSLLEVDSKNVLNRTVSGNHLLLGGDNIDMAIAQIIEQTLPNKLSTNDWTTLCLRCREAKEQLLNNENLASSDIVLFGRGSSIIGGMQKSSFSRIQLEKLLHDGFFIKLPIDEKIPENKSALRSMNLPYEKDPAITRHLIKFLRNAYKITAERDEVLFSNLENSQQIVVPNFILFNGGTMIPNQLQNQITEMISSWSKTTSGDNNKQLTVLDAKDLNLAVAKGAAFYGLSRRGEAVQIKSGLTKAFYLNLAPSENHKKGKCLCVAPRGAEENQSFKISDNTFKAIANSNVQFPLVSSSSRLHDKVGDIVDFNEEEMSEVASLNAMLMFGNRAKNEQNKSIKITIESTVSSSGVLAVTLISQESEHRWPLHFDVRVLSENNNESTIKSQTSDYIIDSNKIAKAQKVINDFFTNDNQLQTKHLNKKLEEIFKLKRKDWSISLLRSLADILLEICFKSIPAQNEKQYLNITGFCLRPGFGDVEDQLRLQKVWKLYYLPLKDANNPETLAEWWIFWRRVAAGLRGGHQRTLYQALIKELMPKGVYNNKFKNKLHAKTEMWRTLGSLELLTPEQKIGIVKVLLKRLNKVGDFELWVLGRLGNRALFHAPVNNLLNTKQVEKIIIELLNIKMSQFNKKQNAKLDMLLFALAILAQKTSNRDIDIDVDIFDKIKDFIKVNALNSDDAQRYLELLKGATNSNDKLAQQSKTFGENLPIGLSLSINS
ncbi:Hsp70 family protein [Lentisphaerota bacterium WC36G]|nr:hsp70 family protein [Lentisphaerae bacterium WC36]